MLTPQTAQNHSMFLVFLYTGARPGSILQTKQWPELYLQWEVSPRALEVHELILMMQDIEFIPVREDGKIVRFDVLLTIKTGKDISKRKR